LAERPRAPRSLAVKSDPADKERAYTARDTRLDRTVAIKILPTHLASDAEATARFDREAKATGGGDVPLRIFRLDPITGDRSSSLQIVPADPTGSPGNVLLTPDGQSLVYDVRRRLSDLYLCDRPEVSLYPTVRTVHANPALTPREREVLSGAGHAPSPTCDGHWGRPRTAE
jgi:hypothetical protein